MKLGLFDVVKLEVDLPEEGLKKGDTGTVVLDFESPRNAYEVEFCDSEGRTLVTLALVPSQISLVWASGQG
jgi:hypothetical protein